MQLPYHRTPVFDQLIKKKKPFITALDRKCSVNIPKPRMRVPEFAPVKLSGTNYRNPQYSDSVSDQRIEIHLPDTKMSELENLFPANFAMNHPEIEPVKS